MDFLKADIYRKETPFYELGKAAHFVFLITKRTLEGHPDISKDCPRLTPAQSIVMRHLVVEDGASQARLASMSGKDNPSITRILDNMEKQGIVVRERSAEDRRVLKVFLTSKAQRILVQIEPAFGEIADKMFKGFSKDEVEQFRSMCRRVALNCKNELKEDN